MAASEQNQANQSRSLKRAVWLALPAWVAFGVEAFGGWRYSKDSYSGAYALHLGALRDPLIWLTVAAVIISPALALTGLVVTVRNRVKGRRPDRKFAGVVLFLIISLLISMGSCVWSCGGHPTWSSGYE